jgi:hypothetical protein
MKKKALSLTLIVALFSTIIATQRISLTEANPNMIKQTYCDISIQSPQHLMTYETGNILLNLTVKTNYLIPSDLDPWRYFYNIDGQDHDSSVEITDFQIIGEENITGDTIIPYIETTLRGQAELPLLANGPHSIKVFEGYISNDGTIMSRTEPFTATSWFFVGTADLSSTYSSISNLTITSPQHKTYNSKWLTLNATADWLFATVEAISYSIYGTDSHSLSLTKPESFNHMNGTTIGTAALPELAEGEHNITVHVTGTGHFPETHEINEETTTNFIIDVRQPVISGLSVENTTYNQLDLLLDFAVNEPTSWMSYSLDEEANVTLTENTTLTLKEGAHSIIFYANDTAGNMAASETIYFTIKQVFPTIPIAAGVATTAVVSLSCAFYFKKRKSQGSV